jgi:ABC-type transport system involved in multi-copper enzyme maturation permease subunit
MRLWAIWSVFEFEFRRTLTWHRLLFVAALALFPAGMISLIQYQGGHLGTANRAAVLLFVLITEVLCLMGMLLWATPAIHGELESKTWPYLAVRPCGRGSILAGKYLAAVAWTTVCAWVSLAGCLGVLHGDVEVSPLVVPLGTLALLSCLVYGAMFILLSVLFLQRAMVAAVAYTALMEVVVAWLPAMINHFSVQYHLRCLLAKWLGWSPSSEGRLDRLFLSSSPASRHLLVLLGAAGILLVAATWILRHRELVRPDEG